MSGPLERRLEALAEAVALAEGRLEPAAVADAGAVVRRAGERLGHGLDATVVALAGPTGAGKSTLFNLLAGRELSRTGVRRPTTAATTAAVGARADPGPARLARRALAPRARRRRARRARAARPPGLRLRRDGPPRGGGPAGRSWSTCSCGSWTRRSTPTPPCTSATCARSRGTPRRCSSCSTRSICSAAAPPPRATTCAGCCAARRWATCRSSPSRRAPARGRMPCAG